MKKRKHHNGHKRAERFFSNVRLWSWESMREDDLQICHGMARAGFVWRQLNQRQVDGIIARANNWIIVCRALCATSSDEWVETEIRAARQIKVNDFDELYKEMRREVFASVQQRHIIDCGWIIQSFANDSRIDDDKLPLFELGPATQERRALWLAAQEERAAA